MAIRQREPPGETFRYNNSGFVVLALVAERAAGRPYHQLVDERVVRAGRSDCDVVRAWRRAPGRRGDRLPAARRPAHPTCCISRCVGVGDGGIVTTADDVHRLWQALFADRIVPADIRRSMVEPGQRRADGTPTLRARLLAPRDTFAQCRWRVLTPACRSGPSSIRSRRSSTRRWPIHRAGRGR